jgi:hypothetical protein
MIISKALRYLGAAMLGSTLVMALILALKSPPARAASRRLLQTDRQARSMVDGKLYLKYERSAQEAWHTILKRCSRKTTQTSRMSSKNCCVSLEPFHRVHVLSASSVRHPAPLARRTQ